MRRLVALFMFLVLGTNASGHHSRAAYDMSEALEMEGELVSLIWRNPHIRLSIKVVDENSAEKIWTIEGWGSLYTLKRTGVTRDDFKIGDKVRLAGFASTKEEQHILGTNLLLPGNIEAILRADGEPRWSQQFVGGESRWAADESKLAGIAAENRGIFRVWSPSGYIGSLSTSKIHRPFTESAVAARAGWDPVDNFVTRCEQVGMPLIMGQPHPYAFEDRGAEILIHGEVWDVTRVVDMNPDDDTVPPETPLFGRAVGHWEGSTLVVETSDVVWPYFDSRGTPQGSAVKIKEEFTLSEDQSRLTYHQTVTDPETFTEPATLEAYWLALGETLEAFECQVY